MQGQWVRGRWKQQTLPLWPTLVMTRPPWNGGLLSLSPCLSCSMHSSLLFLPSKPRIETPSIPPSSSSHAHSSLSLFTHTATAAHAMRPKHHDATAANHSKHSSRYTFHQLPSKYHIAVANHPLIQSPCAKRNPDVPRHPQRKNTLDPPHRLLPRAITSAADPHHLRRSRRRPPHAGDGRSHLARKGRRVDDGGPREGRGGGVH
jgi:hypothetical protein